jgi:hypothetical protein
MVSKRRGFFDEEEEVHLQVFVPALVSEGAGSLCPVNYSVYHFSIAPNFAHSNGV